MICAGHVSEDEYKKFRDLHESIRVAYQKHDPEALIRLGAPLDEYDFEIVLVQTALIQYIHRYVRFTDVPFPFDEIRGIVEDISYHAFGHYETDTGRKTVALLPYTNEFIQDVYDASLNYAKLHTGME